MQPDVNYMNGRVSHPGRTITLAERQSTSVTDLLIRARSGVASPSMLIQLGTDDQVELLLTVDTALEKLEEHDARQAQVVDCRFFGGMTEEETAEALGVGLRTVKRDWARAKCWLYRELSTDDSPDEWAA